MPETAEHAIPRAEIGRMLAQGRLGLGIADGRVNRTRDADGDLVLKRENVAEIAIVAFGPEMFAGGRLNELAGDAHPAARFAHAALQHVAHAKLAPDLLDVDGAALVSER